MTYDEFKILYKSLVTQLLNDDNPKAPLMIFSKQSLSITERLSDLCEKYPEYEEKIDNETWGEINGRVA